MRPFLKTAGWSFTIFYLYQASLNLPEYFAPESVMPCVTRILDSYILWFIFPMSFIMAGIAAADIWALHRGSYLGLNRGLIVARVVLGIAAVAATSVATIRVMYAC